MDDNFPRVTNALAFYLGTYTNVPDASGGITYHFKWSSEPILSDVDIAGWDATNHFLVITPKAAMRVYSRFGNSAWPTAFGVIADGKPVCRGSFNRSACNARMPDGPEIYVDFIPIELNVTQDQWQHLQTVRIDQQGHLEFMTTNEITDYMDRSMHATSDVRLMPGQFDDRKRVSPEHINILSAGAPPALSTNKQRNFRTPVIFTLLGFSKTGLEQRPASVRAAERP